MAKFRIIARQVPKQISVGDSTGKKAVIPDAKTGLWELDKAEAEHLSQIYCLEQVDEKGAVVAICGEANRPGAGGKPQGVELTKESLVALGREQLEEKCKALKLKVDKDESKGDLAEKILEFVGALGRAAAASSK